MVVRREIVEMFEGSPLFLVSKWITRAMTIVDFSCTCAASSNPGKHGSFTAP